MLFLSRLALATSLVACAAESTEPTLAESSSFLVAKGAVDPSFAVELESPQNVAVDPAGNLFVSGAYHDEIAYRISADGQDTQRLHFTSPASNGENDVGLARLLDGRIVVAGAFSNRAWIYRPDGTRSGEIGNAFPTIDGCIGAFDNLRTAATAPDGSFYLAGQMCGRPQIVKYHPDGTRDQSWGRDGIFRQMVDGHHGVTELSIQNDGRVLFDTRRLQRNGERDTSFDSLIALPDARTQAVKATLDGGVLVVSTILERVTSSRYDTVLVFQKLAADDIVDDAWGDHGVTRVRFDDVELKHMAVGVAEDGAVVLASTHERRSNAMQDIALVALRPNGTLDHAFGTNGRAIHDFGQDWGERVELIAMQPSGVVIGGSSWPEHGSSKGWLKRIAR